jgi:hypothetical protein
MLSHAALKNVVLLFLLTLLRRMKEVAYILNDSQSELIFVARGK